MPHPPFPDPDSALLRVIVANAVEAMRKGKASAEQAILHAAVHGWYEGLWGANSGCGSDQRRCAPA
jgi:hypothetical protein